MSHFRVCWLGLFVSTAVFASSAASSPTDLIVRYREPQDSLPAVAFAVPGSAWVRVIDGSNGVLKLHFKSEKAALEARNVLQGRDEVLNVAPDFTYKPAIHYSVKTAENLDDLTAQLEAPWAALLTEVPPASGIPEVNAPAVSFPGEDPLAAQDWAISAIHLPELEAFPEARSSIITAVIDTGIDYDHEDLSAALWRSPDHPSEVGYDFTHDNAKPYDVVHFDMEGCMENSACKSGLNTAPFLTNPGHGTHCAGHIGAVAGNSIGIRGAGGGTQLMALKFFYDLGDLDAGQGDDAAAVQSIDYAIKHGAKVINASWGGRMSPDDAASSELKQALIRAQEAGVIVVVAAGNDGIDQDNDSQPNFPAAYDLDNLIVVAATNSHDQLAKFSNYGARTVHIGAPGVKIFSTTVGSHYGDVVARYSEKGVAKEMDWDGTSMATPLVAGAVAAVWARFPDENYHQIRNRILGSARKVPGLAGKVSSGGILDVAAAIGSR